MSAHLFALDADHVALTNDDWYTPRWIFAAADLRFDMDVAAPVDPDMRTCPAETFLTPVEDGLTTPWRGLVWCNPPYSSTSEWVEKWAAYPHGLLLAPAIRQCRWLGVVLNSLPRRRLACSRRHRHRARAMSTRANPRVTARTNNPDTTPLPCVCGTRDLCCFCASATCCGPPVAGCDQRDHCDQCSHECHLCVAEMRQEARSR